MTTTDWDKAAKQFPVLSGREHQEEDAGGVTDCQKAGRCIDWFAAT